MSEEDNIEITNQMEQRDNELAMSVPTSPPPTSDEVEALAAKMYGHPIIDSDLHNASGYVIDLMKNAAHYHLTSTAELRRERDELRIQNDWHNHCTGLLKDNLKEVRSHLSTARKLIEDCNQQAKDAYSAGINLTDMFEKTTQWLNNNKDGM